MGTGLHRTPQTRPEEHSRPWEEGRLASPGLRDPQPHHFLLLRPSPLAPRTVSPHTTLLPSALPARSPLRPEQLLCSAGPARSAAASGPSCPVLTSLPVSGPISAGGWTHPPAGPTGIAKPATVCQTAEPWEKPQRSDSGPEGLDLKPSFVLPELSNCGQTTSSL